MDAQEIWDKWDTWPDIRIRYAADETGWAKDLGDGRAVIANHPLSGGLGFMDIVKLEEQNSGGYRPAITEVLQETFPCKTALRYTFENEDDAKELYGQIYDAFKKHMIFIEGYCAGMLCASHREEDDILGILEAEGVDTTRVGILKDEEEE
jgi:hypothetical protein